MGYKIMINLELRGNIMLEKVVLKKKKLDDYTKIIGQEKIDLIKELAKPLQGLKVIHVNATSYGGGVAELLNSLAPLLNSVGIQVDWGLLCKEEAFFEVTKNIHNALQGKDYRFTNESKDIYLNRNKHCAEMLGSEYDVVIIHDPQPAALRHFHGKGKSKWVWRCHIDTSNHDKDTWTFLKPFVDEYDASVFTLDSFIPSDLKLPKMFTIAPAIDPLTSKNIDLPIDVCKSIVAEFGINLEKPLLLQVSRFDPWKDPLGVIRVYKKVKETIPELQLAYIGSMADDDPEGWDIYKQFKQEVDDDPNVFIYTNLQGVNAFEVNCFQRVADVVIQKSIREGFGLVVSEALWKKAAVIAGNVGGIPLQISDGENGFLATTDDEYVEKIISLLANKKELNRVKEAGRESVRENFLTTRLVEDEIKMYLDLMGLA